MILGVDIGNYATKDNMGNKFESKVSNIPDVLGDKYEIELDGETYYLGRGEFDTEYRKVNKGSYFKLLYGSLCLGSNESQNNIKLVVGLPLSQFKNDKDLLRKKILNKCILDGLFNNQRKTFIISDCRVYLEGLAAMPLSYEGVFVDIGGRTTDAGITYMEGGRRKVENAYSLPIGSINLYSDFIKLINCNHGLDIKINRAERIIKNGLLIDGYRVDIAKEMIIFKEYLDNLVSDLNVQYSLKTNHVAFTGGGSLLLNKSIKRRIPYAIMADNAEFGNAIGFYNYGRSIWQC